MQSKAEPYDIRLCTSFCNDRLCQVCSNHRGQQIRFNLAKADPKPPFRFLTLTIRSTEDLHERMNRIYTAFAAFKRTKAFKTNVQGGVAFLEVTYGSAGWHPHFHVIIAGSYWDQRDVQRIWSSCVNDTAMIDIRIVKSPSQALAYVTQYASKAFKMSNLDPFCIRLLADAIHNRRTVIPFGTWRKFGLLKSTPKDKDDPGWILLGSLETIHASASYGDPDAQKLLEHVYQTAFNPDGTAKPFHDP